MERPETVVLPCGVWVCPVTLIHAVSLQIWRLLLEICGCTTCTLHFVLKQLQRGFHFFDITLCTCIHTNTPYSLQHLFNVIFLQNKFKYLY